jgi:hypothetical protein
LPAEPIDTQVAISGQFNLAASRHQSNDVLSAHHATLASQTSPGMVGYALTWP